MVLGCFGNCLLARAITNASGDRKRFLTAAEHGNDQAAAAALASRPDLITCTTLLHRKTALHLSAEHGHVAVMASVLELMAESASLDHKDPTGVPASELVASVINSRDSEGRTPLIVASANNQVECARLLLANGAWRSPVDDRGNSALHYASTRGYLGIMLLLLTEFLDELKEEQLQQQAALQQAMAMSAPAPLDMNSYGGTLASRSGAGNRHGQRNSGGRVTPADLTPLGLELPGIPAQGTSTLPDVSKLVNVCNWAGFTPLHFAVWSKQSGAVQVLLQHNADLVPRTQHVGGSEVNIPCPGESTPLHLAAMRGHIEISRILLKTFYERVLEPMQLQASTVSAGNDREALARVLTALDPRTQVNCMGLIPSKVAQRMGFLQLATLLRPQIPLARLFSEEEHRTRFYGPPALKLLAAEALNRKLLARLSAAMAQVAAEAAVVTERSNAKSAATTVVAEFAGADASSFASSLNTSPSSDATSPTGAVVRMAESAPLLSATAATHDPTPEMPVVSAISTPAPLHATAGSEAVGKPPSHSVNGGSRSAADLPSSSQQQQGAASSSKPCRGTSMTGEQYLATVSEADEDERNSSSHAGHSDGAIAASAGQQHASASTAANTCSTPGFNASSHRHAKSFDERCSATDSSVSSSQFTGGPFVCAADVSAAGPAHANSPFAAVTQHQAQLIFSGTGPSFSSGSGGTATQSRCPAAEASTGSTSLSSGCFHMPVEIPAHVAAATGVAAGADQPVGPQGSGAHALPRSVRSSSGRLSVPGSGLYSTGAPLSRFAADANMAGSTPARSPRNMPPAALERVLGIPTDGSTQLQPVPISSTGSRVFALQRGTSVTLVGAASGTMPGVNEAMAPFMALDNLADLVEDTASALPRGSLVCWSRPRLDGPDDDEGDALWSAHPFRGQEEGGQPLSTTSQARDSAGTTPTAPSSPVPSTPPMLRNGALGSVSARLSASGAASSLRAAVVRSFSMSGSRQSSLQQGGAAGSSSPPAASLLNMVGCLPGLAASAAQQQGVGVVGTADPQEAASVPQQTMPASPTSSMVMATLSAADIAAVVTLQASSSTMPLSPQPAAEVAAVGAYPASPQPLPSMVSLITPEPALGTAVNAVQPASSDNACTPASADHSVNPDSTAPPPIELNAPETAPALEQQNLLSSDRAVHQPAAVVLPQVQQSAAVAAFMALGVDDNDHDGDQECGVCMEYPAVLLVQPCQHNICGPCAHKMCTLNAQRTPHCPFCRAIIADFHPNMELAGRHVPMP